jgi:hypothetical protein
MTPEKRRELENDLREMMCAHQAYKELLDKVCEIGRRIRNKVLEAENALDGK